MWDGQTNVTLGSDVLVCGGWNNGMLSSCELYTPGNNTWNTVRTNRSPNSASIAAAP